MAKNKSKENGVKGAKASRRSSEYSRARRRAGQIKSMPLYAKVKATLADRINSGLWAKGYLLPSETNLAESMDVSLGTVRRALAEMAKEGLIVRRPKTGTIVTGRTPHHRLEMSYKYFRLHGPGDTLRTSVTTTLSFHIRSATEFESNVLNIAESEPVTIFDRLRTIDDAPIMWERYTLPSSLVPEIESAEAVPAALALHLLYNKDIQISSIREKLSADISNAEDTNNLGKEGAFPVLVIEAVAFDQLVRPIFHATHRAITTEFKYINEIN